ncbi:MAG: hypothetical protein HYS16_00870 [Deltaproteobacteria bacterium]|nr:MAG: hypothetical protein HYS16_00870 [Deltaproteobacteria bacterium]
MINWWHIHNKEQPAIGFVILSFILFLLLLNKYVIKKIQNDLKSQALLLKSKLFSSLDSRDNEFDLLLKTVLRLNKVDLEISRIHSEFYKKLNNERNFLLRNTELNAREWLSQLQKNLEKQRNKELFNIKNQFIHEILLETENSLRESEEALQYSIEIL